MANGGKPPLAKQTRGVLSKALEILKSTNFAESPAKGHWRISENNIEKEDPAVDLVEALQKEPEVVPIEQESLADTVLGQGASYVYLYYLPLYRTYYEGKGNEHWPCKIGRSDIDPIERIYNQTSIGLPEVPIVAIIINTDLPNELEKALQHIISLRKRKIKNAPGKEWFLTNPKEIIAICEFIFPEALEPKESDDGEYGYQEEAGSDIEVPTVDTPNIN